MRTRDYEEEMPGWSEPEEHTASEDTTSSSTDGEPLPADESALSAPPLPESPPEPEPAPVATPSDTLPKAWVLAQVERMVKLCVGGDAVSLGELRGLKSILSSGPKES